MPWKRATGSEATNSGALLGRDHAQPVGLAVVGGELGDELAIGNAGRGGQLALLADAAADVLRDRAGAAEPVPVLGDVEIGFVEAQRLDQVGVVEEDRADLLADGAIDVEPRLDEDQVGAAPLGGDRRHRRAHAKRPRLIARRGHHAAMPAADRHRLALQLGSSRCSTDA